MSEPARDEAQRQFRPDLYWYLSFRCNLACQHCSVRSTPQVDTSSDLDTAEAMRVIEQMVELRARNALVTGGEVLFRPDALQILAATADAGIAVGLETNGLLISDEFIRWARAAQDRKLFGMCVSLDGGTAEAHDRVRGHNTFKRTLENLHRLKDAGVQFDIQCILNRDNYPTIPQLMDHARALRPVLRLAQFGFLNPVGRGDEYTQRVGLTHEEMPRVFDLIAHEQKHFDGTIMIKAPPALIPPRHLGFAYRSANVTTCATCQFPLLGILPNGDVTVCAVSRNNEQARFGNVRTHRLKEIWIQTRMDELRHRYVAADHLTGVCGDCMWQQSCKGSCRAWAYERGGSFDAPFPPCDALDKAGHFPKAYRISTQQKALGGPAAAGVLAKGGSGGGRP